MISTNFRPRSLPASLNVPPSKNLAKPYAYQFPAHSSDSLELKFRGTTETEQAVDQKITDQRYKLLCQAARTGDVDSARNLLKSGVPAEKAVEGQATPAEIAAHRGHADVLELLLTGRVEHGLTFVPALGSDIPLADPKRTNKAGMTLFHQLATAPYKTKRNVQDIINTANVIARAKVNINQPNHAGFTALHLALDGNNPYAVKALLLAGADPTIPMPGGKPLLSFAQEYCNAAIVEDLKKHTIRHHEEQIRGIRDIEEYEFV